MAISFQDADININDNMIKELHVRVAPQIAATESLLKDYLAEELAIDTRTITSVRVLRRSIDARQRNIFVNLKVRTYINEQPTDEEYVHTEYNDVSDGNCVIVVFLLP